MSRAVMVVVSALAVATLGGCGAGSGFDEEMKTTYRTTFIKNCLAGAEEEMISVAAARAAEVATMTRVCTCTADRNLKGRTGVQVSNMSEADQIADLKQCMAEVVSPEAAALVPAAS